MNDPLASISLDGYQKAAGKTAIYPGQGTAIGLSYVCHKLAGETGEFCENFGKAMRDDDLLEVHEGATDTTVYVGELTSERKEKMKKELGDILWYVARAAFELGYELSEVADDNLKKLASRKERNMLHGSGSDR